jgi:hypothetical protein
MALHKIVPVKPARKPAHKAAHKPSCKPGAAPTKKAAKPRPVGG